ncbi:MAG: histidine phosphatase family protein [Deltaproteobacteria bacterium]|nr:histidine phosphatase family protein [Deltaproteobacteria bacterium]
MQRELLIARHAKSSWKSNAIDDHSRPLNARGQRDAPVVAAALLQADLWPDRVYSSDALRTRETWAKMAAVGPDRPVHFDRRLYLAGMPEVLDWASEWPDDAKRVLVLGHNPGWEEMAARLAGRWQEMTTSNIAIFRGHGATWPEALEDAWQLVRWLRPREISLEEAP